MIVCNCNPFSDRDVKAHLQSTGKTTVAATYKCCSGGASPECCRCLTTLKDMVQAHNADLTIENLKQSLPQPVEMEEMA